MKRLHSRTTSDKLILLVIECLILLLVFSLTNMPQFKNKEKSTYFTGDTKIFSKSKLPKHFRIFISCSSTFEHFSFFSTYDKVEKNKISIVISYSSTFECFSYSSSFMHKWRRRKKVWKTQSNDHRVVTRGQK